MESTIRTCLLDILLRASVSMHTTISTPSTSTINTTTTSAIITPMPRSSSPGGVATGGRSSEDGMGVCVCGVWGGCEGTIPVGWTIKVGWTITVGWTLPGGVREVTSLGGGVGDGISIAEVGGMTAGVEERNQDSNSA